MENLLIFYEIYQGTSSIKSSITFFTVQSGYHYYFEDIIWKGNKRIPRNPERLFKKRWSMIIVVYRTIMKDTLGRKQPPINSGMFWVRRDWMISRLTTNSIAGRELFKELKHEI